MLFNYKYSGSTQVSSNASSTALSFVPDATRPPTYFSGDLNRKLPFREAISALHDVVISDLRFKPKDKTEYLEWAKQQEDVWLAELLEQAPDVSAELGNKREELRAMDTERSRIMQPFYTAQRKYFDWLYKRDRDAWFVLDPVITVHPDELFFECFSEDESSYGRLGCNYEVFENLGEIACGTTNIDYSAALYDEFQKIRDYKTTRFQVEPGGFDVETTNEDSYREVKIDLPASWIRGFLQVSSAMTLPGYDFDLHPMDLHNFCFVLRRMKERHGPRSIRFELKQGKPVVAIFEPWNYRVSCPRSIYQGTTDAEIRIWGRRRLLVLERLIPVARRFKVKLLGTGLPSFFMADLGDMNFTLGLSGWTANDWSRAGNFDLMAPRADVSDQIKTAVFEALQENWLEAPEALARRLNLNEAEVLGALASWTQAGRAIYDLNREVYRVRELSRAPLPMRELRFANDREEKAQQLLQNADSVKVRATPDGNGGVQLRGAIIGDKQKYSTELNIDSDQRLLSASCTCSFYQQNKLYQGPCEHILATRLAYSQQG